MNTSKKHSNSQLHGAKEPKALGMSNQANTVSRFFGLLVLVVILVANGNQLFAQIFNHQGRASAVVGSPGCHEITPNGNDHQGAIWEQSTISLNNDFEIKFSALLGASDAGADGIALVLQNSGPLAIGGNGAALGFGNFGFPAITQSLAVEFDTYDNGSAWGDGGSGNDHIAIVSNGNQASPLVPIVDAHISGQNIEDNQFYDISVTWNAGAQTLLVYFDGELRTSITQNFTSTVFGNNPNVFWGITGATGHNTNRQVVCNPTICIGRPEFQASIGRFVSGLRDDGEEAFSGKPANDCGYIAAGQTAPVSLHGTLMVAKTDIDGLSEWVNTYSFNSGNPTIDEGRFNNIEALGDGYIVTGWTRYFVRSLVVLRLENDGSVRWASAHEGSHIWEEGYDIEPTPDGGFVIVGSTQGRVVLIHLDENGTQNWARSYGVENEAWRGYSVEPIDNDGDGVKDDGFAICGAKTDFNGATWDWLVITTNNTGILQSAESIGTFGQNDEAFSIKQVDINSDGVLDPNQFVVGGYISDAAGTNPARRIGAFMHYSPSGINGNPVPTVILDDTYNESVVNALEQDANGDIVCAGSLNEAGSAVLRDAFFVKSHLSGSYSWSKVYGTTSEDDWFNSIEEVNGLGYVLAGGTHSFGPRDGDFYMVKIDEWGNSPCNTLDRAYGGAPIEMYSYVHNPQTQDFGEMSSVTMVAIPEADDSDACLGSGKKESQVTSVNELNESNYTIYPNPVSNGSSLQIVLDETISDGVEVTLTDITGKVHVSREYSLAKGSSTLNLPINNLSPGIYHLSVRSELGNSVLKVLVE